MNQLYKKINSKHIKAEIPFCTEIKQKMVVPANLRDLIRNGEVTYVSIEKIKFLNFTLVDFLEGLSQKGKPVVVNILDDKDTPSLNIKTLYHFLAHLDSVSFITDNSVDPSLNIKHISESFFSNSFFIGEEMSALTEERIRDMRSFFRKSYKKCTFVGEKYLELSLFFKKVVSLQTENKTVAIVSGVFDVLHEGHIGLLEDASNAADVLIILTNSDYSTIRQAKNSLGDRPIHSLEERISVLSALSCTSFVTAFDSETILPILSNLTNIIYVKTEKDVDRDTIINEMQLVLANKGTNIIVPFSKTKSGNDLSSSIIIKTNRLKRAPDFILSPEEAWSKTVIQKITQTTLLIKKSSSAAKLWELKRLLRQRHSKIIDKNVALERRTIAQIAVLAKIIIKEFNLTADYYTYLIPYILGKLIHLNIKILPIQNSDGNTYSIVNAVQLINGKTNLFDLSRNRYAEPFIFEDTYWKVMAHHSHYLAKTPNPLLPLRLFFYPFKLHYEALSLKILMEESLISSKNRKQNIESIKSSTESIWQMIENVSQLPPPKGYSLLPVNPVIWPGIVAHGGSAVLSQKFPQRAENSLTGITHALKAGVDIIEIDINACKDGWVVYHDQKLEIGTMNKGAVADLTEAELTQIKLVSKTGEQLPERIITLKEALALIYQYRKNDNRNTYVKLDIKFTKPTLEKLFVEIIKNSQIPLSKTLITSELPDFNQRVHLINTELPFELNTVESNLFLLSYGAMNETIMLPHYINYIEAFSGQINAKTVSLAQFAIKVWGTGLSKKLIYKIHQLGLHVQVWTITSMEDYFAAKSLEADYALMQSPSIIAEAISLRQTKHHSTESLPYF